MRIKHLFSLILIVFLIIGCQDRNIKPPDEHSIGEYTSFQEEKDFLEDYIDVITLTEPSGKGMLAVSAALQGRVMTSSANGPEGRSYGWINRAMFESGDTLKHINPYGGEERFWLGPEGGQFSIFFETGDEFDLVDWQTPRLIDLDHYEIKDQTKQRAVFSKSASLTNYSGFIFEIDIERSIEVLSASEILESLKFNALNKVRTIGYRSTNTLTNRGNFDWKKETGLLSIWLLGMFQPTDATTVIVPFHEGSESKMGVIVNDNYFGKVPSDRLIIGEAVLYFRGDGKYRSKIGLLPGRAKNILGSYDAQNRILTVVKYSKPDGVKDYVNSLWEIQDEPYRGDVINSYNDGPPAPGAKPLGPFYELETSSPALELKAGESGTHIQETFHFEGKESDLDGIAKQVLGVSLEEVKSIFN